MYIPPFVVHLLLVIYLLFMVSAGWVAHPDGAWYRPFLLGLAVVLTASLAHRRRDADES